MYTQKKAFFMICETPVHAGSGSDLGIVDLPIQREKHTGYPKIEASGLKGVFREYFKTKFNKESRYLEIIFGPEEGDGASSAVGLIDARILFFPIKSVKGIFAYVTCKDVLARFKRDMEVFGYNLQLDLDKININLICKDSEITKDRVVEGDKNIVLLEEYVFKNCTVNDELTKFAKDLKNFLYKDNPYWAEKLEKNIIVVNDNIFKDFIELYSEVIARTKIDHVTGTVVGRALWYEEYLPADTILYSCLMTSKPFVEKDKCPDELKDDKKILDKLVKDFPKMIQLGGNSTIGKGLIKLELIEKDENEGGENA